MGGVNKFKYYSILAFNYLITKTLCIHQNLLPFLSCQLISYIILTLSWILRLADDTLLLQYPYYAAPF